MRLLPALLVLASVAQADVSYGETYRLKVPITGENRKAFLFLPRGLKKGAVVPLVVAVPSGEGSASLEVGQWQQPAFDKRFAVFSVDIKTCSLKSPWHWKDGLVMQRDMEAVIEGLKAATAKAKEFNVTLDRGAVVMTGHSGGTYLTLWLGVRRPDLFLGIAGRSCVFFKETIKFGKFEKVTPNYEMPILIYHGELDAPRSRKDTRLAKKTLDEAGFKKVELQAVEGMKHESKPEVFLEWFYALLKKTSKGRKDAVKIAQELEKLRPDVEAGRAGSYGKLARLAEREEKAGFAAGAKELFATIEKKAVADLKAAEAIADEGRIPEALKALKKIEKTYAGLQAVKDARAAAKKLRKSDGFAAFQLLEKAKKLIKSDRADKAALILETIVETYPSTAAASEAAALLK
ncbi:MAG: hypothetical protein OER88_01435 [Planctomycetota bacterium]|nr:hypothetical protein [Planctomycetota bacterium]